MRKMLLYALCSALFFSFSETKAQSSDPVMITVDPVRTDNPPVKRAAFLLGGALELGGDAVAVVDFQDGSKQKVNAGQGGTFFAGGEWTLGKDDKWGIRATLGIKYVTTKATNVNITLTRIPLRITGIRQLGKKWWIAAGAVTHQASRFNAGGIGQDLKFTGAISRRKR